MTQHGGLPAPQDPRDLDPTPAPRRGLDRRAVLALGGALALAGLTATPATAGPGATLPASARAVGPTGGGPARGRTASVQRAHGFLAAATDAYPDVNPGPRLAQSYADQLGLFSTAFVYDNALAILATLTAGRRHLDRARALGDGLVFALENDPDHADGRLRQAYNVGPYTFYDGTPQEHGLVLPDGTANVGWQFGFLGTAVGDMAWPGIALLHLHAVTRERRYRDAALRIGEWIVANTWSQAPLGGFSFGVDGANVPIPNGSTEHNIDCVAFFRQLGSVTRDRRWDRAAEHARAFVDRMWEPGGGYLYTGTNDGTEINRDPLPLDPQTWGWLALRERGYARALDWADDALAARDVAGEGVSQLPAGTVVEGVTFSSASLTSAASYNGLPVHQQGVWLEGTAQLASALADRGARGRGGRDDRRRGRRGCERDDDRVRAEGLLREVQGVQEGVGAGQTIGGAALPERGGVVAASSLLDSGFGFGYFQVQHVGATSWYLLAAARANPLQPGRLG
ncbi:Tat pathway signal sequence domain protein [Cellulosimicrobium cellulans]|uniref:Tat pathway signal sequence domain protein n=1 Tax=Cellulosimicrobium cellulans TaxID=1710 RepID=A0A1Y0HVU3_CELCE|nr:Tat pathway signal sequence domain protein [Cellulosimicrobium cellulans]ARU52292.1 Tat pathway signal sequence domain protein [Cellulosimicrobium cellulans]